MIMKQIIASLFFTSPVFLLLALAIFFPSIATAANTQINCGSTYYVPLLQVNATGTTSALPSTVKPVASIPSANSSQLTATIGTMPGGTAPAVVLKPTVAATGVVVTVSDSTNTVNPGSATFDLVNPPAKQSIMLDTANTTSTTP